MWLWKYLVTVALAVAGLLGGGCSACGPGDAPPEAGIDAAEGHVRVEWKLRDPAGNPVRCDQLDPNASVTIELQRSDQLSGVADTFDCQSCGAEVRRLVPGNYRTQTSLKGLRWGPVDGDLTSVAVAPGDQTARATFTIDPRGALRLQLSVKDSPGDNCVGPQITAFSVALEHITGGCEPATFVHARKDGTVVETYVVNCGAVNTIGCFPPDDTLTATVPSGTYRIHVRGKKGAVDRFANDNVIRVYPRIPADRAIETEPLSLTPIPAGAPDAGVPPAPVDAGPPC